MSQAKVIDLLKGLPSEKQAELLGREPDPVIFNLTDLGNARRLVDLHGQDIRYCHAWGKWLIWTGQRWKIDSDGEIIRRAKATVATIYSEAAAALNSDSRREIARHAAHSESEFRIKSMVSLSKSEQGVPVSTEQLDADPWLMNCTNGTLDLRTSELHPHRRGDFITKLAPVVYDPLAECPTWIEFLQKTFQENGNLIAFIQKTLGYSLTGSTREQVIFFLYGAGANGKSTLINVISAMLGDYALQTPAETFLQGDRAGGVPNDVARLKGSRFVSATEAGENRKLDEVLIKQLTGGDTITARFLHQEFFEFKPEGKIFFATNHKPRITGTDSAIWRRVRLIPFEVTIPEAEQDRNLPDKLRAELPGILAWTVKGCLGWQQLGLGTPDEVVAAGAEYRASMDTVGQFLDECCEFHALARVKAGTLYGGYSKWCSSSGEKELSNRVFSQRLAERGIGKSERTEKGYFWQGLRLNPVDETDNYT